MRKVKAEGTGQTGEHRPLLRHEGCEEAGRMNRCRRSIPGRGSSRHRGLQALEDWEGGRCDLVGRSEREMGPGKYGDIN